MPVGDLYKVVIGSFQNGKLGQNVLYYVVDADSTGDTNQKSIELEFLTEVIPKWQDAVGTAFFFECIIIQKVFPGAPEALFRREISEPGNITTELLPATSTALIRKFNPAVGGKGKKGRVYISGWAEANQDNGNITTAGATLLGTLSDSMQQDLINATDGKYAPAWAVRGPGPTFPITGFVTGLIFEPLPRTATQRRRRTPNRVLAP